MKKEYLPKQSFGYPLDSCWHITGKRIPFPFSLVAAVLFLLLMPIGALVYGPFTALHMRRVKRRERIFAAQMQEIGRLISWEDAVAQIEGGRGSLVSEYASLGGPHRVWWTADDVVSSSPFAPCFVPFPYVEDDGFDDFYVWCADKYMDPKTGGAKLVDTEATDGNGIQATLDAYMQKQRCVSIGPV